MSIIAETLKRLQAQSEEAPPHPKTAMGPRPVFNKGEGVGRHRKDSGFGFLMVMVGMTITLGGLAIAAFWIGGQLDFGLATNTQARMNDHLARPNGPDLIENPVLVHQSSETREAATTQPSQFPKSPPTPATKDTYQKSASLSTIKAPIPPSPHHEVTTPSRFDVETMNPSSTKALAPKASQDQETLSSSIDQSSSDIEKSTILPASISEEQSNAMIPSGLSTSIKEYAALELGAASQEDAPEDPKSISMSVEEEMIQTEEFVKISRPLTDSAPRSSTHEVLKARREPRDPDVSTIPLLQPTQRNRLRHAQQLIQSGEYEGAVALLSPLFHEPPVKWEPWFWMGTALLGQGDIEQADQFFLSGLARNDKIPQLWIQRALVAQQRGDYQLAIHELRQAETLEADLPHIHLNMGYAYERLGNDRLANEYYGKFLKLSEAQPAFFSIRKKLFARLTQHSSSLKDNPTKVLSDSGMPPLPSSNF
jgi:tetratricopeptide (TPR) repeat protein